MTSEHPLFLSTQRAGRREIRFAIGAMVVSGVLFAIAVPFAKEQLRPMPAFVPIYVSTLVICDVITAVLLFGQFNFLRARSLLLLACGYLFTAVMTASYVLMFPGLFAPDGLLGAGPQSTSAMYIFWHGGFPVLVICYALFKQGRFAAAGKLAEPRSARGPILTGVGIVFAVVAAYTALATAGHDYLPLFIEGNRTTDLGHMVLAGDWVLSLIALIVLWWRRPHTVIDLWLMVVMCVWLFDLALAAILNTGRYDLGWYVGRIYGLLAASALLIVLLIENGKHYARLVRMSEKLEQLSLHDGLTKLANRRFFDAHLATQLAVARRHERSLAIVLCDVDCFKNYNDHYGHQAGDECLRLVAEALRSCCRRPGDMAARYGGEEFALILPDTSIAGASQIAEAARDAVQRLWMPHARSSAAAHVSISGGVAVRSRHLDITAEQMIAIADDGLFQAKRLGRNRMLVVQSVPEQAIAAPVERQPVRVPRAAVGRPLAAGNGRLRL